MTTSRLTPRSLSELQAADLPPAVRVFWQTAPEAFRVPSILTALDCYCALSTRLRAKYVYDLEPHALLIQLLVLGEPGSGKSFTRPIVRQLLYPLRLKDIEQKRIEQAYQELKKTASKNKPLPEEPVTCTRNLQTITRAKLVKRADMFIRKYGEPLAFFFFNEELATMTESNKRAFADLNTMDRLAYDLGAEYGSDTLSDSSYNADVDIIYCSLFCGTDNALSEYINKRAIEGGNCTRKILTRIDEDVLGADAPCFRQQTAEETKLISETVNQLMQETYTDDDLLQPVHLVDMSWLDPAVKQWCKEQRNTVLKTGSRAHNCFYKRSSVSAFRLTVMFYHLWCLSEGEDDSAGSHSKALNTIRAKCTHFYRCMADYILEGLLNQWGKSYDELHKQDDDKESIKKVPFYDQIPTRFSRDQLQELCMKLRLSPARVFLHKWKKAKLIYQPKSDEEIYVKNYPTTQGSTPTAGNQSPQASGNQSPQASGNQSPQTSGNQSSQASGNQSPQASGNQSPQASGNQSPQNSENPS